MQNFIKLQNILINPHKTFHDFKSELTHSGITQFTYICLLLNIAATIKRPNFQFELYLDLLTHLKNEPGYKASCVNYTGYKDKISILMNACEKSVSSTVALLVSHPDIKLHLVDPNGLNAVFYAIKNPEQSQGLKMIEIMHQKSLQIIDTVTNNGFSPLFLAVQKFRIKIVEFLLRNQINPNQCLINSGNTALHELIKAGSKYSVQQIRRMVEVFLRHDFDLGIKNNLNKTVEQYALQLRVNLGEIVKETGLQKLSQSQVGSYQESQTEAYSSKIATTKVQDIYTTDNYSQLQESDFYHQFDAMSVSNKSLLSEVINCHCRDDYLQLSVCFDGQSQCGEPSQFGYKDQNEVEILEIDQTDRKIQCFSHSDSPQSGIGISVPNKDIFEDNFTQSQNQQNIDQDTESSSDDQSIGFQKTQMIDYLKIQKQILEFDQISQGIYISAWQEMQPFFLKLQEVTAAFNLTIEIIGSFATGLWTHHSDVDIALVSQTQSYVDFERLLQKVFNKIKVRMYNMGIKQLSYNKASKIPSIKIQMDFHLFGSRKIDIMIFHRKNIGITYVNYICQALSIYGQIRPLFYFLKRVCEEFGLHDPFNGGMKSYSIFLIIYSMIRTLELNNLGQILLKTCLYYGFYHNFDYEIEYHSSTNGGFECFPMPRLNIVDPLNTKNNMGGKNTDVYRLKNMFRTIYYGLHRKIKQGTTLQYILQLTKVIL